MKIASCFGSDRKLGWEDIDKIKGTKGSVSFLGWRFGLIKNDGLSPLSVSKDELGYGCAELVVEPVNPHFVFSGIFDTNVVGSRCRVGGILVTHSMIGS